MFKNLHKVIVAVAVFAMTIGSGFAMETNPPTEPVKAIVETDVIDEVPQQVLSGYGYYNSDTEECHFLSVEAPIDCSILNSGSICTVNIGLNTYLMFLVTRPNTSSPWTCTIPLRKPI